MTGLPELGRRGDYLAEWFVIAPDGERGAAADSGLLRTGSPPVGLEIRPVLSLDDIIDSKAAPLGWLTEPTGQASVCLFEFYVLARDYWPAEHLNG